MFDVYMPSLFQRKIAITFLVDSSFRETRNVSSLHVFLIALGITVVDPGRITSLKTKIFWGAVISGQQGIRGGEPHSFHCKDPSGTNF